LDGKLRALSIILILQVVGFVLFSIIWASTGYQSSDAIYAFIGLMTLLFIFGTLPAWIIGNIVVFVRNKDGPGICRDCVSVAPREERPSMPSAPDPPMLSSEFGYQPPRQNPKAHMDERQLRFDELDYEIRSHAKMLVGREPLLEPLVQTKLHSCPDMVTCLIELENLETALNHIEDILPLGNTEEIARAYERIGLRDKAIEIRFTAVIKNNMGRQDNVAARPPQTIPSHIGVLDDYRIMEKIGCGGFCDVYVVEKAGVRYALKIPKGIDLSGSSTVRIEPRSIEKFNDEAAIWSELTTKAPESIVKLMDSGVEPFPWFVMELADKDLASTLPSLDFSQKMVIVLTLLENLQRIHALNVVHRDIKPENILLSNGSWKFTDFGLSKITGNSSMSSVNLKGTLNYLAPEQVSKTKFGPVDQRTDIWQMGVLMVFITSGSLPFRSDDPNETIISIMVDEPDLSNVPEIIHPIVSKALKKNREERWQSCSDLRAALLSALDNNLRRS
jgi:hypothetical protein